jgi:hypothetical protein
MDSFAIFLNVFHYSIGGCVKVDNTKLGTMASAAAFFHRRTIIS